MLKHEDWPGLDKITAVAAFHGRRRDAPDRSSAAMAAFSSRHEMERGADGAMTGYAFPDMLVDVVGCCRRETAQAHDLFDRTCRSCAMSSSRGSVSRCANMCSSGAAPLRRMRSASRRASCPQNPRQRSSGCSDASRTESRSCPAWCGASPSRPCAAKRPRNIDGMPFAPSLVSSPWTAFAGVRQTLSAGPPA